MLEQEFAYFKEHQTELFKEYPNQFIVIKGDKVHFSAKTFEEALANAVKKFELGTFLVQQCTKGEEGYTQTFHSRVSFA